MPAIVDVTAREILDSRGHPTVEVDVRVQGGALGRAAVPSGASTGSREALELRDGDPRRYAGKGVLRAVANVRETIAPAVRGLDAAEQEALDRRLCDLDGTPGKARLGANAVMGVSVAAARAAAEAAGLPLYRHLGGSGARTLPVPLMNVINGGVHADNDLDVQEFMLAPVGPPTFAEALRAGVETFHALKALLRERGQSTAVGDEGGFAPDLGTPEAALEALVEAIGRAGYRPGRDVALALDCAASELRADGAYRLQGERLSARALIDRYAAWIDRYPIVSIEDGLGEDDWEGWRELCARLGGRVQIVGDDLLCTNLDLLRRGIAERAANAILVKVNQIGTLTEALAAVRVAREAGWGRVISHRSGETEDTLVADLAVAAGTGQIKTGSASRSDRVAKYNRLLRIAEELGEGAAYPGGGVFARCS